MKHIHMETLVLKLVLQQFAYHVLGINYKKSMLSLRIVNT